MKKNSFIIITCFIIIYFLFTNQNYINQNILNISHIFLIKILPTLFPLFIIAKILTNYNLPYYLAKIFKNNLYSYVFFISLIGGCPNNVIVIKDLLENNQISEMEANKYIKCSFFSNPLFLYSMLSNIFELKLTIIIIISHYLANLIIFIINPLSKKMFLKPSNSPGFNNLMINSLKESTKIFSFMYLTIVFFNILILCLPNKLLFLSGFIELTQGLNYLAIVPLNTFIKVLLALFYISFGGFAIQIQVANIILKTPIKFNNFLKGRMMQII